MKLIMFAIKRRPFYLILGLAASLCAGLGSMSILLFLIHASESEQSTYVRILLFSLLALFSVGGRVFSRIVLGELSGESSTFLRRAVIQRILLAPLARIEQIGADLLDATLLEEISLVSRTIPRITQTVVSFSMIILGMIYLYAQYPAAGLALTAALLAGIPIYILLRKSAAGIGRRRAKLWENLYQGLSTLARGVKELKMDLYRQNFFLNVKIFQVLDNIKAENAQADVIGASVVVCGQALAFLVVAFLIFSPDSFGVRDGMRPSIIIIYLLTPLDLFLNSVGEVFDGSKALERVNGTISMLDGEDEACVEQSAPRTPIFQSIRFSNLTYEYPNDSHFQLGPVSISLTPGKIVFLTGGNGSGKTTLFKMLSGLYVAKSGDIWLNDEKINGGNVGLLRSLVTAIFDDFHLFEEIIPRSHGLSEEDIQEEMVSLQLGSSVSIERNRLSRTKLSKGQKKRLALLNAYIDDRPIFLFDEWAADQDPQFRKIFYKEILPRLRSRGKAVLAITHDEHYFGDADEIVEMRNGVIYQKITMPAHGRQDA